MAMEYDEGLYQCEVRDQAWQRARSGNKMLVLSVVPQAQLVRNDAGKESQVPLSNPKGRTVRLVVAGDVQAEMVLRKLRHAGFEGTKWSEVNLRGSAVRCVVTEGTYNNEPSEQWDLELPGSGPLQDEPDVAEEMDSEFPLAGAVAVGGNKGKSGAAAPADDDDDIPF